MKECILIYNPNSGHKEVKKYLTEIENILNKKKYNVTIYKTEYKGHATEIVEHMPNVDLVMSFGGDGTFNEVVYGNIQRKRRLILAHIPVGTTNDVGTMFGYGKNIEENLKLCLKNMK